MRAVRLVVPMLLAVLATLTGDRGATPPAGRLPPLHPATVEPTLPLAIEMRLDPVERAGNEARTRLVVLISAARDISDLELTLVLPGGMEVTDGSWIPDRPLQLTAGEQRSFVLPVRGRGDRDLPIRVEAAFRTRPGGYRLHLGQGVTLSMAPPAEGRSHAGAWEVMAVPLEEIER